MIKNVIFDIGNVLVNFRWPELLCELGIKKETREILARTVFASPWWAELDRGVYEEAEVVEKFREANRDNLDEFELMWANRGRLVEPFAYSVPWIAQLKARGVNIYLLSNYPKDIFTLHAKCGCFPFLDMVDGRVVSAFVRMVKPDAEIYEYLMKEYSLAACECVFIDDREENVEAAQALGMKGIVFRDYGQTAAELERVMGQ